MKNSFKWMLLGLVALLISLPAVSQSRSKLENERKQLQKDIKLFQKELNKVAESERANLDRIMFLQGQIYLREKLIKNISKEVAILDNKMKETSNIIAALERDLEELKEKYSEMVFNAYKHRASIDQLIFIFSADSFNDAIMRLRYVQQVTQFRKRQAELIDQTRDVLNDKLEEQERIKKEKEQLMSEEIAQKNTLKGEQIKKDQLVQNLKSKKKNLSKEIEEKQLAEKKLAKKIEEIIALEAAKGISADLAVISEQFGKSQGKLKMPVSGPVVRKFGKQPHATNERIVVENNGIDIRTSEGAAVKSVFGGEVRQVLRDPTFHVAVLVSHGEYYTFYYNLQESFVKKGQRIAEGHEIGIAYTDGETGRTEVHIEIWKGKVKLDPELWISKH